VEKKILKDFLKFQQDELNSVDIYSRLAKLQKNEGNKKILEQISAQEAGHYNFLKKFTGTELKRNRFKINWFCWMARIFGLTFTTKLMEEGEGAAVFAYKQFPELETLANDEEQHEHQLINMIDENRLKYMSSIVLGLNDALVEFTGALAGYTLALGSSKLIALTGSITGIAAALSMASSEYLSSKAEGNITKEAAKAASYTGATYLVTVILLILPFILLSKPIISVIIMLVIAMSIIAAFNYYFAVARSEKFSKRFAEMAILSFSVAAVSFGIGYLLKLFTGIDA